MPDLAAQRAALRLIESHIVRVEERISRQMLRINSQRLAGRDMRESTTLLGNLQGILETYWQRRAELLRAIADLERRPALPMGEVSAWGERRRG